MSTILDALRKVEEARRMKTTDVRTRLLTGSSRFDLRQMRHKRLSWFVVAGLILGGIIVGTGVGRWKEPQLSGGAPSGGAGTPADSPLPEQGRPQSMAKTLVPRGGAPSSGAGTPAGSPLPEQGRPQSMVKGLIPPPPQVALADRLPPGMADRLPPGMADRLPPGIAGTPLAQALASRISPRPIPPVPNSAQGESTSVPVAPVESRNARDQTQVPQSNLPSASLPEQEEKIVRDQFSANPVQKSPFVTIPEPERSAPPSPVVERRAATPPKSTAPSSATKPTKIAKAPPVEPTPAPLEDEPIAETTPPPTSASLSFLQWSPEPEKRIAFIKIGDGPTTLAHEGDTVNGVTIVRIRQEAVDLQSGDNRWTLRTR